MYSLPPIYIDQDIDSKGIELRSYIIYGKGTRCLLKMFERSKAQDKASEADDVDPYGLPRIPLRGYYDVKRCDERRRWVEKFTSTNLRHVGEWWADEGKEDSCSTMKLKGNAENVIGLAKIPIGVAGPLLIRGEHVNGHILCPFATTEGALIASATRGATALSRAGGVVVQVGRQRMLRAPAFVMRSIRETHILWDWLAENFRHLKQQVALFSQHCILIELLPFYFGKAIVVQFIYETGDAAGQNMTTSATWHACKWALAKLEEELLGVKVVKFYVESNVSGDKKMAAAQLQNTRGWFVQAEAWIPEELLRSVLKIDSTTLLEAHRILQEGAIRIGALGSNVNVANLVASVFIATGQDVANVVESATAQLHMSAISKKELDEAQKKILHYNNGEVWNGDEGGVYVSMQLPSVIAATVGGGTTLATQKECLHIMGCHGKGGVRRLVEIIAGFALALDISTLASIASGHFASAHERLGRNRPEHGLREVHLNKEFFSKVVGSRGTLVDWKPMKVDAGTSIISELTKTEISKKVGHFGYIIRYTNNSGEMVEWPVVIKSKPLDSETATMINKMAQACGLELAVQYERHKLDTGFRLCHTRELAIVQMEEPEIKQLMPEIYYSISSISKDMFVYVMEYLSDEHFTHFNTADDISGWTTADIKVVLRDMAIFHAHFMTKLEWLRKQPWIDHAHSLVMSHKLCPLWKAMLANASREFPEFWTSQVLEMTTQAIDSPDAMWKIFNSFPHTLIHNDCNPRNICIHKASSVQGTAGSHDDPRRMCLYDWELARIDVPQHDLAEFLAFVLQPDTSLHKRMVFIDYYISMLEKYSEQKFNQWNFLQVLDAAALDFQLNRLNMYTMAHTFKDYKFLARVVRSNSTYLLQRRSDGHLKFITMAAKL